MTKARLQREIERTMTERDEALNALRQRQQIEQRALVAEYDAWLAQLVTLLKNGGELPEFAASA